MKLVVVAVRDSAVDAYAAPFFMQTTGAAVRSFRDAVNSKESGPMFQHPEDYSLFQLAVFDEETGKFENLEVPAQLVRGQDCKES